jgi:hypothetical protein
VANEESLVFNILGRDKVGPVLARVKAEVAAANDSNVKGIRAVEDAVKKAEVETRKLGDTFRRTGDLDVWKAFKDSEKNLATLRKMHSSLNDLVDDAQQVAQKLPSGILGTLSKLPPQAIMGISGAVLAIGPAIGGMLSGAITAALGGGALAAGIALAAQNSRVKDAFGLFGVTASEALEDSAGVFVEPLVRVADKWDETFSRNILPSIREDFAALAPVVDELGDGIAGLATAAMPGLNAMLREARPVLSALAQDLPEIGQAFGDMLADMSNSTTGAVTGIHLLTDAISGLMRVTGMLVGNASRELSIFNNVIHGDFLGAMKDATASGASFSDFFIHLMESMGGATGIAGYMLDVFKMAAPVFGQIDQQGPVTGAVLTTIGTAARVAAAGGDVMKVAYEDAMKSIQQSTITADTVAGAMAMKILNSAMQIDQAYLGLAGAQNTLTQSLADNGRMLNVHTQAGMSNRQAVLGVVQANMAQFQANINAGMSAQDAAAAYDDNTRSLEHQMHQAGFTQEQIDGLVGKYRGVPTSVNTNIAILGLTEAIANLEDTIRLVNGIPSRTVHQSVIVHYSSTGSTAQAGVTRGATAITNRWGGVYEKAELGTLREAGVYSATDPGRYMIAEPGTGGEAFVPKNGNATRSASILSKAAAWYGLDVVRQGRAMPSGGGANVVYNLTVTAPALASPTDVGAAVITAIRDYEKSNGKGWRST